MRDRWIVVLALAFFLVSGGGTAVTVLKLSNIETGLSTLSLTRSVPSSFPSKVDLSFKKSPLMVTATVKFVNGSHNRTLGFQAPTYEELRQAVIDTQAALAREWGSEVTVEWLGP